MKRNIITDKITGISLRKLEAKDADKMLEWMHDENVAKNYKKDFLCMTKEKVLQFISSAFSERSQHFAIVDSKDEYLGTISLKNISVENGNAEYAIVIRPAKQHGGVGSVATRLVLEYAFAELRLHKVYLNVPGRNAAAIQFYEKCGFIYEGTFKQHLMLNGKYHDLSWYGIVSTDFLDGRRERRKDEM